MAFCFYNNGMSMIGVANDYVAKEGEVVFQTNKPTDAQLNEVFPLRAQLKSAAELQSKLDALEASVQNYIYAHYSQGTQASFVTLYASTKDTAIKAKIESFWAWTQTILNQYYKLKNQIQNGGNPALDFTQFDNTDPDIHLADFIKK